MVADVKILTLMDDDDRNDVVMIAVTMRTSSALNGGVVKDHPNSTYLRGSRGWLLSNPHSYVKDPWAQTRDLSWMSHVSVGVPPKEESGARTADSL